MSHSQAWGTPCERTLMSHVCWDANKIQAGFRGLIILGTVENHWEPTGCQAGTEEILISETRLRGPKLDRWWSGTHRVGWRQMVLWAEGNARDSS